MNSGQYSNIPLVDISENGNDGTDETTLNTVTIPPGFFKVPGDGARITGAFSYAANGNTKTVKLYFGSSTSTVNGRSAADNGSVVIITALITNKPGSQRSISWLFAGASGFVINKVNQYVEDINQPIKIRITGQSNAASDDITSRGLRVEYVSPNNMVLG